MIAKSGHNCTVRDIEIIFFYDFDIQISHLLIENGKKCQLDMIKINIHRISYFFLQIDLFYIILIFLFSKQYFL